MTAAPGFEDPELLLRTRALEALFDGIARSRMAGLPIMNAALHVEAVDFALEPADKPGVARDLSGARGAVGILITPWFMNLVWLPLVRRDTRGQVGASRLRNIGLERFSFTGAHEDPFGSFEACSMFSPMFEFTTHSAATATASTLLAQLRRPVARPDSRRPVPPRRAFLLGRGTARDAAS